MAVFINANEQSLEQIEIAVKANEHNPELENEQLFIVGESTANISLEEIRKYLSAKYGWVSKVGPAEDFLPDHLKVKV